MIVIATAGHVDHGKSTLIERLTGIDPDRWDEEKRRGLTIDLGFAWTRAPRGDEVAFVDVPGHERFIGNMLAGVGSVPAVILVIDATEGWRAQTFEHLAILDLLEVRHGIAVVTKADRATPERIGSLQAETRGHLAATSLAAVPVLAVSARTGDGIDALWEALQAVIDAVRVPHDGIPRMWLDRAFTIAGAGTVVTGTLTDGSVSAGMTMRLLPSGSEHRVRAVHRHNTSVDRIEPVARAAINLAGSSLERCERGMLLTADPHLRASARFDVELRVAAGADGFTGRGDHRLHAGTGEAAVQLRVRPGPHRWFARVSARQPLPLRVGDRFVLRDTGRHAVVAGGRVLDAAPMGRFEDRLDAIVALAAAPDLPAAVLADRGCVAERDLGALVGSDRVTGIELDDHRADPSWLAATLGRLAQALDGFHARTPLAAGMPFEDARIHLGLPERVVRALLRSDPALVDDGATIRLATFRPAAERLEPIVVAIRGHGMQPPDRRDLEDVHGGDAIATLVRAHALVALDQGIILEAGVHADAVERVLGALEDGPQTTSALRQTLGTSRRIALPFLESLDRAGITRFDGSVRRIGPNAPRAAGTG